MSSTDSISVKVTYKTKNVIIGKGIQTQQQIITELQKRFPQISILKSNLIVQYEQGVTSLQQAYQLAIGNNKKNIKVKIIEDKLVDKTTVIQLPKFQTGAEDPLSLSFHQQNKKHNSDSLNQQVKALRKKSQIKDKNSQQMILKNQKQTKQSMIPQAEQLQQNQSSNKQLLLPEVDKIKVQQQNQKNLQSERVLHKQQQEKQKYTIGDDKKQVKEDQFVQLQNEKGTLLDDMNYQKQEKKSCSSKSRSKSSLLKSDKSSSRLSAQKLYATQNTCKQQDKLNDKHSKYVQVDHQTNKQNTQLQKSNKVNYVKLQDTKKSEIKKSNKNSLNQQIKDDHSSLSIQKIQDDIDSQKQNKSAKQAKINNNRKQLKLQSQLQFSNMFVQDQILFIKKQFTRKIQLLEKQNLQLNIKYQDLSAKYDRLISALQNGQFNKKNQKGQNKNDDKIMKDGYKKLPQDQQFNKLGTFTNDFHAEIIQKPKIQNIKVGQMVMPRFIIKNIGQKKWPQNVYAIQKNSMQMIQIQWLQPDEQTFKQFGQQKGTKIGEKITKTYQLCAYNKKGQMIIFGPEFGYKINVIGFKTNEKLVKEIQSFIKQHKVKTKLKTENIIEKLQQMGITQKNFNECDEDILLAVISG